MKLLNSRATESTGFLSRNHNQNKNSFIARYVYTYKEFVFMTEATAVQQNDSDRTKKNTDNKKKI